MGFVGTNQGPSQNEVTPRVTHQGGAYPDRAGHPPSRTPLTQLVESLVQGILCPTSLDFVRYVRKIQEMQKDLLGGRLDKEVRPLARAG